MENQLSLGKDNKKIERYINNNIHYYSMKIKNFIQRLFKSRYIDLGKIKLLNEAGIKPCF